MLKSNEIDRKSSIANAFLYEKIERLKGKATLDIVVMLVLIACSIFFYDNDAYYYVFSVSIMGVGICIYRCVYNLYVLSQCKTTKEIVDEGTEYINKMFHGKTYNCCIPKTTNIIKNPFIQDTVYYDVSIQVNGKEDDVSFCYRDMYISNKDFKETVSDRRNIRGMSGKLFRGANLEIRGLLIPIECEAIFETKKFSLLGSYERHGYAKTYEDEKGNVVYTKGGEMIGDAELDSMWDFAEDLRSAVDRATQSGYEKDSYAVLFTETGINIFINGMHSVSSIKEKIEFVHDVLEIEKRVFE